MIGCLKVTRWPFESLEVSHSQNDQKTKTKKTLSSGHTERGTSLVKCIPWDSLEGLGRCHQGLLSHSARSYISTSGFPY